MSMNVSFSDIPNPQNVPILPNRFKQRSAFVKDADGFFQCRLCDQKYKCSSSISRHNRTVHLEKLKYQCKGCSKKFYEKRSWIRHLDTYTHLSGEMFCSQLQTKNSNNKDSKVKSRQMGMTLEENCVMIHQICLIEENQPNLTSPRTHKSHQWTGCFFRQKSS